MLARLYFEFGSNLVAYVEAQSCLNIDLLVGRSHAVVDATCSETWFGNDLGTTIVVKNQICYSQTVHLGVE